MAPKRKNSGDGNDRPPKKTKDAGDNKNDESDENDENDGNVKINWVIPEARRKRTADRTHIDIYAQRLYARDSETLRSMQNLLQEAQIRTPIYERKGNDMAHGDANQSSAALRSLLNEIKSASLDESNSRYRPANLAQHFEYGDDDTALALSRAENNEVLVMYDDRQLQV
jgi:hypothetical protein